MGSTLSDWMNDEMGTSWSCRMGKFNLISYISNRFELLTSLRKSNCVIPLCARVHHGHSQLSKWLCLNSTFRFFLCHFWSFILFSDALISIQKMTNSKMDRPFRTCGSISSDKMANHPISPITACDPRWILLRIQLNFGGGILVQKFANFKHKIARNLCSMAINFHCRSHRRRDAFANIFVLHWWNRIPQPFYAVTKLLRRWKVGKFATKSIMDYKLLCRLWWWLRKIIFVK